MNTKDYDSIVRNYIKNPEYFFSSYYYSGLLDLFEKQNVTEDELRKVIQTFNPLIPEYIGLLCLFFPFCGSILLRYFYGWKWIIAGIFLFIMNILGLVTIFGYLVYKDPGLIYFGLYVLSFVFFSWFFRRCSKIRNSVCIFADIMEERKKETN